MTAGTVHVIGAGLAGLAAAVALARGPRKVVVHELARFGGGRCRSFFEPALGLEIDNGSHLVLSGNHAVLGFLETIGAAGALTGPETSAFDFADAKSGARWTLRPNAGRLPWWIFAKDRRVPGTRARDYLALVHLLTAKPGRTLGETVPCSGTLYERLTHPLFLAALNTEPPAASATLAGAIVRETLARGGSACRPLIAAKGLDAAFITPALTYLERHGVVVRFDRPLRRFEFADARVRALEFDGERIELGAEDLVILAVPAWVAPLLVPGLLAPQEFRSIINTHFRIAPPPGAPKILGVVNGTSEWLFAFPDRIAVTISSGDRYLETEREPLAREIWSEVAKLYALPAEIPPWQIIKERRATFASLPAQEKRRPGTETTWRNLLLAGDWTATGLPATIEGAIRSGNRAAELAALDRI